MQKVNKQTKAIDLRTEIRVKFDELTPDDLALLSKMYDLKKDSHKFLKIIKTNSVTQAVEYFYQIKQKDAFSTQPVLGIEEIRKASAKRPGGKQGDQSPKREGMAVFDVDKDFEVETNNRAVSSGKSSVKSKDHNRTNLKKSPYSQASPKDKLTHKSKTVARQIKQKESANRISSQSHPAPNVFKSINTSQIVDEISLVNSTNKANETAGFFEVPDESENSTPIKTTSNWHLRNISFGDNLNCEEDMPDPAVLAKVKRAVELLAELHQVDQLFVVRAWLERKDFDQVKIHLANSCTS